jgi:hypothetical protein
MLLPIRPPLRCANVAPVVQAAKTTGTKTEAKRLITETCPRRLPRYDLAGFFSSLRRLAGASSGGHDEVGLEAGIIPCLGVPQTTQASALRVISAPQHAQ